MRTHNKFFIFDTHYGHKNLVRGISTWGKDSQTRDFDTVEEMNDAIVDNINRKVGEHDILYHGGDFAFGGIQGILEFRNRINCKTIHFLPGNHDHHISNEKKTEVREIFKSIKLIQQVKLGDNFAILSHFPMMVWDKHHIGYWHLHGHCHGNLDQSAVGNRLMMDCGIDTHPNFEPYSVEEIEEYMKGREVKTIDHHIKSTTKSSTGWLDKLYSIFR